ncbi:baseplate J/gp47 family protein, partial [Filifactor alocis]|uniref:baseplate J/gp47 family protein n=1 Tax=Filifactor alocis TaxID=143361 RepID=UPI003FA0D212
EGKENKTEFGFFALASPLFQIRDGDRRFLLKLKDKKIDLSKFSKIEYTTEDGWKSTDKVENLIIIPDSYPAITPYNEKVHQATLDTDFPVLRFVYESNDDDSLLNKNISIEIDVKNFRDVQLKNDLGNIDGSCSFLPFGYLPYVGSDFYIVNPFVFNKCLKRLKLNGRSEKLMGILNKEIYKRQSISIDGSPKLIDVSWSESTETNDRLGFVKLTSNSDFGYATHQNNYLNQINETLREAIKKNEPFSGLENFTPFQPPKISDFSIDYKMVIDLSACRRYEILPAKQLEYSRVITELTNLNNWMSKRTIAHNNAKTKLIEKFSYIISLKRIEGPCIISLYFRLKDSGILHANMDKKQPTWHYLSGRKWIQFKEFEIIRDTTDGFLQSGHVYFKIGADAIITDSKSDKQLFLKLSYPEILRSRYPILEKIYTQSVDATFIDQNNDLEGFPKKIPANTITRFQKPIQGIKSVMQPYQASGGRAAETPEEFYTRVSERLRHKKRAWNIWDYERIVLENFPEIYKVKCIPYADEKTSYAPGSVLLVLLPDCNSISQNDILKPMVPLSILREVKRLIAGYSSPFVKVNVCNASFVELKISCTIVLKKEYNDHSFYRNLLNEELNRLLSPWIDNNNEIRFGRIITLSQILYFIEQREYVDYIVQDKGIKITARNKEIIEDEYYELLSQNEILTSAKEHNITILN